MALDAEYFDSIYIEVVKKKYYEAAKVQQVFGEIRRQAEALNAENARLRQELARVDERKVELGDALLSAQTVYQDVIERAKQRAAGIVAAAEQRSEAILEDARRQSEEILSGSREREEEAVQRVERAFRRMKQLHMASIDALNAQWQDFLCSLDPAAPAPAPAPQQAPAPAEAGVPADLEAKVGAIADQVFSLERD